MTHSEIIPGVNNQAAGGLVISEVVVIVTNNCSFSAMFEVKAIRSKGSSSFLPVALEVYQDV